MTAIILAGGKSSRLGFDKTFMEVNGEALIKRQIKLLKNLFKEIIIVTDNPDKFNLGAVRVIKDVIPMSGPLGGIYSGLLESDSLYNFVLACDMPFLNTDLVRYMFKETKGYDLGVPEFDDRFHVLYAIYSRGCIKQIKAQLDKRIFKIRELFKLLKVKVISENQIKKFDPKGRCFTNINTPQDYKSLIR